MRAVRESSICRITVVLVLLVALLAANGCGGPDEGGGREAAEATSRGKLRLVATIYPLAEFARQVGGDRVAVVQLIPQGREPHHWEPSPADMLQLYRSQVFFYNGAGMEPWVEKVLPALRARGIKIVKATEDLDLLTFAEEERLGVTVLPGREGEGKATADAGHRHRQEDVDPHVWLDPVLAKRIVAHLARELIAADPAGSSDYMRNAQAAQKELDRIHQEYLKAVQHFSSRDLVVSHAAFGYLARRYGLRQIPLLGLTPEQEPDAATLAWVVDYCREQGIKCVFFEAAVSPRVAETVAREAGAQTFMLNPIGGITEQEIKKGLDYFGLMRQNLESLQKALRSEGERRESS